jgi:CheY-like chemotaxis protein
MPHIDGKGVAAHIRKSKKQSIPVIAMSGTPWLLENETFDMVLSKPFPLHKLIESIRSLVPMPSRLALGT